MAQKNPGQFWAGRGLKDLFWGSYFLRRFSRIFASSSSNDIAGWLTTSVVFSGLAIGALIDKLNGRVFIRPMGVSNSISGQGSVTARSFPSPLLFGVRNA